FAYCDSGMIPWLLVAELACLKQKTLGQLVSNRVLAFPASGEINSSVVNQEYVINNILDYYKDEAKNIDFTDGISIEFENWRFNLRSSNTEPVIRLNVESKHDTLLMKQKTQELLEKIKG
ncbi:phosphomannomutase CpsG, partial [Citrobacter sp. wls757]